MARVELYVIRFQKSLTLGLIYLTRMSFDTAYSILTVQSIVVAGILIILQPLSDKELQSFVVSAVPQQTSLDRMWICVVYGWLSTSTLLYLFKSVFKITATSRKSLAINQSQMEFTSVVLRLFRLSEIFNGYRPLQLSQTSSAAVVHFFSYSLFLRFLQPSSAAIGPILHSTAAIDFISCYSIQPSAFSYYFLLRQLQSSSATIETSSSTIVSFSYFIDFFSYCIFLHQLIKQQGVCRCQNSCSAVYQHIIEYLIQRPST